MSVALERELMGALHMTTEVPEPQTVEEEAALEKQLVCIQASSAGATKLQCSRICLEPIPLPVQQDGALAIMRGVAILGHDVFQACSSSPSSTLQQVAGLLHDNCILVSGAVLPVPLKQLLGRECFSGAF